VDEVVNETTIPTSSRDKSFDDFIRDNANYIHQIVETYRQRFGCVLLCFYTLATNCYAFTYENILCMFIFASLSLLNEKCATLFADRYEYQSGRPHPSMSPKQIPFFEEQNPEIAINLYAVDPGNSELAFTIEYLSFHKERQHHVYLLLLENQKREKSLHMDPRHVSPRSPQTGKNYVYNSCLHSFTTKEAHDNHLSYCQSHPSQQVKYPDPAYNILKFKSIQKQHPIPFYLVCDFESFLTPSKPSTTTRKMTSTRVAAASARLTNIR